MDEVFRNKVNLIPYVDTIFNKIYYYNTFLNNYNIIFKIVAITTQNKFSVNWS